MGFVITRPRLWGYASVPVAVLMVLGTAVGALGIWAASAGSEALIGSGDAWHDVGRWALTILLSLLALVLAMLVAFALAQPISGFALEAISKRQESELGGRTWPDQKFSVSFVRTLKVTLFGLLCSLPIFAVLTLIGLAAPPATVVTIPLKLMLSALLIAWDLLDYPLGIRGAGVRDRLRFIGRNFGAVFLFGSLAAIGLLIPGLGLLLLPYGVAGASRLVVWDDQLQLSAAAALEAAPSPAALSA
jgi:CysZ protein